VAEALGLIRAGFYIQWDSPANAYLALDGRLPLLPDRDVALTWHEEHGWSAGIETDSSEDLVLLAYFGNDVLPAPRVVADFARRVLAGEQTGQKQPPALRSRADHDDLHERLAGYARAGTVTR
jgi:hypothetical protein